MGPSMGQSIKALRLSSAPTPISNSFDELDDLDCCGKCEVDEDELPNLVGFGRCCALDCCETCTPGDDDAAVEAIVSSIKELKELLKSSSKISRLIQSPTKRRMKKLSELVPGIPCEEDEVVAR